MVTGNETKPGVTVVLEPIIVKPVAQPRSPGSLQRHARPYRIHGKRNARGCQRREPEGLMEEGRLILLPHCVEKVAIPDVQTMLCQKLQDNVGDQGQDQQPGVQR